MAVTVIIIMVMLVIFPMLVVMVMIVVIPMFVAMVLLWQIINDDDLVVTVEGLGLAIDFGIRGRFMLMTMIAAMIMVVVMGTVAGCQGQNGKQ
ncbi:MAG: hypothetical protein ACNA7J_07235 [Wenzhouxiangella sp.]